MTKRTTVRNAIAEALDAARQFCKTEPCAANLPLFERMVAALEKLEALDISRP